VTPPDRERSAELFVRLREVLQVIRQTEIIAGLENDVAESQELDSLLASLAAQREHFCQLARLYDTAAELVAEQQKLWPG
jgi:hypothetical protein